jgi:tellurite resistance protein
VENVALDAIAQYNNSGRGKAFAAINQEWAGVSVLAFVCRADGQMRKEERAIIADYIKRHNTKETFDDAALNAELDDAIKAIMEPDSKEFKRIVRDLKNAGERDRLTDLLDCAIRIVGTQRTVALMERAAVDILKNSLL